MKKLPIIFLICITILNVILLEKFSLKNNQGKAFDSHLNKLNTILKKFNISKKNNIFIFHYKTLENRNQFFKLLEKNNFLIEKSDNNIKIFYENKLLAMLFLEKVKILKPKLKKISAKKQSNFKYLSIIIDDIGPNLSRAKEFWKINDNITLSIIPFLKESKLISIYALKHHLHVMLHMPMEPAKPLRNYNHFLLSTMDNNTFKKQLFANLKSIPFYEGINNHMGSKLTCNREKMELFFSTFEKGKFFIDSKTARCTIAGKIALKHNIKSGIRDIFIDNKKEFSYILKNLQKAEKLAMKNGFAIAIGHPDRRTVHALSVFIANKSKNLVIIPVKLALNKFEKFEKKHIIEKEIYEGSSY